MTASPLESAKAPEALLFRGLALVAGARNHLPANRPLEFRFEIAA